MTFVLAEDLALKTYLANITVADDKNPARPVGVWFGYPDVEIRTQNYPFITIDLIAIRPATERQAAGEYVDSDYQGTIAPSGTLKYRYEIPVAYDLIYQVTTYSRHPRHDRGLIFQLMQKFPHIRGYLPVPNQLGTSTAYRHMFMESYMKRDSAEGENGNKRLLRNVYTVRVVSEMTPSEAAIAIPSISVVNINRNSDGSWTTTSIPAGKILV